MIRAILILAATLPLAACAEGLARFQDGCWRHYEGAVGVTGFVGTVEAICGSAPADAPPSRPAAPGEVTPASTPLRVGKVIA